MIHITRAASWLLGIATLIVLCDGNVLAQGGRGSFGGGGGGEDFRRRGGEDRGGDFGGGRGDFRERMRERFGGGGGFPGGGDFGGGGFGGANPWGGGGEGRGDNKPAEPETPKEKPRVTKDLPSDYLAGDLDQDGQIGFYEWRLWQKTGAAQFARWDTNNDGFLTPRELEGVAAPSGSGGPPTAVASTSPGSSPAPNPFAAVSTTRALFAPATPKSPVGGPIEIDPSDPNVAKAKNYFSLMDENKDSLLSREELEKSNRVKTKFKEAGVEFTQPMTIDQFVETYVRVSSS